MCGIWGIIPGEHTPVSNVRKFVTTCMIAGTVRGDHGTGIMMLGDGGVHNIIKGCEDGVGLLSYKGAYKALYDDSAMKPLWALVGHNRAATRGDIDDDSAHPFRHGNITLVHNGYIGNAEYLPGVPTMTPKEAKSRVDSDMLCQALNHTGHETILKRVYGAWALVWHDQRDNALRFFRNSQRPLAMMRLGCGGIAFASEGDMLWWAAGRSNLDRSEVRELAEDTLLTITKDRECSAEKIERFYSSSYYNYDREGAKSAGTSTPAATPGTGTDVATWPSTQRRGVLQSLGLSGNSVLEFEIDRMDIHHGTQIKYSGVCYDTDNPTGEIFNAVMYAHAGTGVGVGSCIYVRPAGVSKKDGKKNSPVLLVCPDARGVVANPPSTPVDSFLGPEKSRLTRAEWDKAVENGCVECHATIRADEAEEIVWILNEKQPLCPRCASVYREMSESLNRTAMLN